MSDAYFANFFIFMGGGKTVFVCLARYNAAVRNSTAVEHVSGSDYFPPITARSDKGLDYFVLEVDILFPIHCCVRVRKIGIASVN
ncbi:hypothetical protein IV203_001853 [Nitzschia inconspicua]|uniref:Uncharacterized protein n=1 Tax=Nitzschia inconspicua TaxID=303405 RepID=A0A9K3L913_9STRA|nr:hypothetical protein IV203_001853 [Nitzschia inconspicua]